MKKSIFLLLLAIISSVHCAYADETRTIKLDNKGHEKEAIQLSFCNIFVELQKTDEDDQYKININLENVSEDKILYLFDVPYNEKTLKKTCNLVYDKTYPGTKGKRVTESCEGLSESCRLLPSESKNILNFQGNEESRKCRLPIYIARITDEKFLLVKKSKVSLAETEVIELNIDVELKPDEDFVRLSNSTDSLLNEIGRQTFCSNRNHRGTSLKSLKRIYGKSIDELKRQTRQVLSSRHYMSSDKGYKQFAGILEKLNAVNLDNLTVASCKNDRKASRTKVQTTHNCRYCSLSIGEIYKKMEAYYIDLHNGKKTKGQIMGEVDELYNCAQKNSKRATGNYMSRISTYYSKIKSK